LKPEVENCSIFPNKYTSFRCDRLSRTGGGVLIAVKSDISSEFVSIDHSSLLEFVCVKVKLNQISIYITCSYIPPSSDISVYLNYLSSIQSVASKLSDRDYLLVFGDFNLPEVGWSFQSGTLVPSVFNSFLNALSELPLYQLNNVPNCSGRILDLVFSSDLRHNTISRINPLVHPEDPYHPTFDLVLTLPTPVQTATAPSKVKSRCFRKTDFEKLNFLILEHDWSFFYSCSDLSTCISFFYSSMNSFFDQCVPLAFPVKSNRPPWFSRELIRLKNLKSRYFKKFKLTGEPFDFSRYTSARASFIALNASHYNEYLRRCRLQFAQDPKQFYNFVNLKRKSNSFPSSLFFGKNEASSDQAAADLFADFFQSTYSNKLYTSSAHPYPYPINNFNTLFCPTINKTSLLNDLKSVKPVFSPGPDGVPGCVLRFCADSLLKPIFKLLDLSLSNSHFPPIWKNSFSIPPHKSGSNHDVKNYRCISKLSAIPKIFEKNFTAQLTFMCKSIISPHQHGFVKARSTASNLLEFSSRVSLGFRKKMQTDVVYTDFSKAFDSVNHNLLIHKLNLIGFPQKLLLWISDYLTNRSQRVLFKNCLSKPILVTSGVPQGSHLGPLLFNLFINDLPSILLHSDILMYADDVKLCLTYSDPVRNFLQTDLDLMLAWCRHNLLHLNCLKCKVMSFYRGSYHVTNYTLDLTPLSRITEVNDLGILFDHKLKFDRHISQTVNKAFRVFGFIKRWAKEFKDPYTTKLLYTSLVRPILEYGSCVWSPQYQIHQDRIESVQKQFLLFALRSFNWVSGVDLPPYSSRLLLINLPSLTNRRIMLGVTFLFKLIKHDIDSPTLLNQINFCIPSRVTRNFVPLSLNLCFNNYSLHDPFRVLCADYNRLFSVFNSESSLNSIKLSILNYLTLHPNN
jgi:hypothetical protein